MKRFLVLQIAVLIAECTVVSLAAAQSTYQSNPNAPTSAATQPKPPVSAGIKPPYFPPIHFDSVEIYEKARKLALDAYNSVALALFAAAGGKVGEAGASAYLGVVEASTSYQSCVEGIISNLPRDVQDLAAKCSANPAGKVACLERIATDTSRNPTALSDWQKKCQNKLGPESAAKYAQPYCNLLISGTCTEQGGAVGQQSQTVRTDKPYITCLWYILSPSSGQVLVNTQSCTPYQDNKNVPKLVQCVVDRIKATPMPSYWGQRMLDYCASLPPT